MKIFHQVCICFFIFCVSLSRTAWADDATWPQLDKAADNGVCSEALKIAKSAYYSDHFYFYQLPVIPQGVNSAYVLKPSEKYVSSVPAVIADEAFFQKIPTNNKDIQAPRSIYWQRTATHGQRFVVSENVFGWRGDEYALYSVSEGMRVEAFLQKLNQQNQKPTLKAVIEDTLRMPFLLQDKKAGDVWVIDVSAENDWVVYSNSSDGAKQRCTIHFLPKVKSELTLLPKPVRTLAMLLDGTLGSGENEGTLWPTSRIRTDMMHTWANVALRPWAALKREPYNSRKQVDFELKDWSRKAKSFHTLYQDILAQYPHAERALSRYYKTQFHKKPADADAMAKQALDIAFRSYFAFSKW
jgi:hypothetical protein